MKQTLTKLLNYIKPVATFSSILNYGGTLAIAVGLILLPIDISFRLILVGVFSILLWKASIE